MLTTWIRRLYLSQHRGRVAGLTLSVLVILLFLGGLLRTLLFSQISPSPNPGKSVLLLSNPSKNRFASVTLLTMIRISDGKVLWQYHLQSTLANGYSSTTEEQLKAGTAVRIVDGIVYFAEVFDASPDRPAMSTYSLTALQADTGALLWQHQMQATTLEVLGVSNGVLVSQATVGSNSTADALTVSGYRAESGSLVWERQIAEHISYRGLTAQILKGILYVGKPQPWTISALEASTGRPLWQYTTKAVLFSQTPLIAEDGVVVLEGVAGDIFSHPTISLIGLRESDGALLWSREISKQGRFPGTLSSPFQAGGGLLYFATNVPEQNDLELNAVQIARGTLLWHQQVTAELSISGRELALANGTLYFPYTVLVQTAPPVATGLAIQAVQASNGALRWKKLYHPGQTEAPGWAIVDGTSASTVFAESSDSQHTPLIGLGAGDGATLWQDQRIVYREFVADGKLIVFSTITDLNQQLCALQPATSTVLWCHDVDKFQGWAIAGP